MSDIKRTRTRDELIELVGEAGADNLLSFPDERSHAVLTESVRVLTAERAKLREERDRAVRDVFLAVEQRDAAKRLLSEIGAIVEHDSPLDDSLVAKVRKVTRLALATDYDIGSS